MPNCQYYKETRDHDLLMNIFTTKGVSNNNTIKIGKLIKIEYLCKIVNIRKRKKTIY